MHPYAPRPHRLTIAATVAALIALCATLLLAGEAGAATKPVQGPGGLKFYNPPNDLPKGHGKLIWQRPASGLVPIDGAGSDTLVLYTSKTPQGKKTAVSGSVSVPEGEPPQGGWPVISYAHGSTGTSDSCAPTRVAASNPVAPFVTYIDPELEAWIDAGYAVLRSDFQGLGTPGRHPYLVGKAEGRGVLDIINAARQLNPEIGKRFLLSGHSQGGHAVLFAARQARNWAPATRLTGTVSYAPASHILEQAKLLPALTTPSGLSALASLIVEGAASQTASIQIPQLLSDPALALFPEVDRTCLPQLGESDSFGGIAPSDLLRDGADTGPLFSVLADENPAVKTKPPILLLQGSADTTVFPMFTDQLDGELLALGDQVTYSTYPGVTHGEIPSASAAEALAFMKKRLPPG